MDVLDKIIAMLQDQYQGDLAIDLDEGELGKIGDVEGGVLYGLFPLDERGNPVDINNPTRRFVICVEEAGNDQE